MFFTPTRRRLFSVALMGAITLSTALANAAPAAADQAGVVCGVLVDASNNPVSGAEIVFAAPTGRYRTRTDRKGWFTSVGMFSDTYMLVVLKNGIVETNQPEIYVAWGRVTDLGPIALPPI